MNIEHLYIHIPFCKKKCPYCNFISYDDREALISDYIDNLVNNLSFVIGHLSLRTVYVGGGTPSLLSAKQLEQILQTCMYGQVNDLSLPEISLEINPATADYKKLKAYRKLGINRLSIGAQSFNNRHLKILGRIHSAEDTYQTFEDARKAGFDNIGIDIMYALPGQTFDEFKNDIETVLKLNPEHISLYNLEIEKKAPFYLQLTTNNLQLPENDIEADMFEYAIESFANAGYKHYEISNFAKPGKECRHNIAYWLNKDYLGIGAGAHSHVDGKRWDNNGPLDCDEKIETIFMGLRLLDGISKDKFIGFEKEVSELKGQGLLEETATNIRLTKKGLFLANIVFEKFVCPPEADPCPSGLACRQTGRRANFSNK